MLKYNLRLAWRQMRRHPLHTSIHILGLSIGVCACLVIWLLTRYDLSFDRFHPDGDRIYRIVGDVPMIDGTSTFINCPFGGLAGLEHEIPGFEEQAGFHFYNRTIIIPGEKGEAPKEFSGQQDGSYAPSTIVTGPAFFELFPHRWLAGNPAVLDKPGRIVFTESAARKYFGKGPLENMLGKTVIYADSVAVTVGGIVGDWDGNSDLDYTGFISISSIAHAGLWPNPRRIDWTGLRPFQSQAFVKLAKEVSPERVNAEMNAYVQKLHPIWYPGTKVPHMYLQTLYDLHFTPEFHRGFDGDKFRKTYRPLLYALMGVAFFILLLAVINFINLSTAQSLQRMKEVGIRKVMGSSRKRLTFQFLAETFLLTFCAIAVSALLVRPALLLFAHYVPPRVRFEPLDGGNLLFLLGILVFTTLVAGYYPARVISGYLPVLSLKGAFDKAGAGGGGLRKALIVFQFTISLVFMTGSLVVGRQVRYMRSADKGFNSDAILVVNNWRGNIDAPLFAQRVRRLAGVRSVIVQSNSLLGDSYNADTIVYKGRDGKKLLVLVQGGDAAFLSFYGMRLLAGRNMFPGDSVREMVINATYSRALGFGQPDEALGKLLYTDGKSYTVVGVVADYFQRSFHEAIRPLAIMHNPNLERSVAVKLASAGKHGAAVKAIITAMEKEWKKLFPKAPFDCDLLNDSIARLYDAETNIARLMEATMGITILISCLGLFGLALFTVKRRTKEIGIRKVMGATVGQVAMLLSRDFLRLVVLAFFIAAPATWYWADRWLQGFSYRRPMSAWVLAEAGLAAVGLALLTVSIQAVRAARANPMEALRDE